MEVPLEYTDQTDFELAANLVLLSSGAPGGSFAEIVRELTFYRTIAIIVCFAALVILLIALLTIIGGALRKRK
jgi:hypothetical protein